jgi:hypothetical protein
LFVTNSWRAKRRLESKHFTPVPPSDSREFEPGETRIVTEIPSIRARTELRVEPPDLSAQETGMQAGIRHPNPPPPRGPDKLAASRSPGTHLEAQENEVPRIKPAPDAAGLPFRSSRRSSGLDTGGLDLWPPLLGLATSHARRRERERCEFFFFASLFSLSLFFSATRRSRRRAVSGSRVLRAAYIYTRGGLTEVVCVWDTVVAKGREYPYSACGPRTPPVQVFVLDGSARNWFRPRILVDGKARRAMFLM